MFFTGVRPGEAMALKFSDLSYKSISISFHIYVLCTFPIFLHSLNALKNSSLQFDLRYVFIIHTSVQLLEAISNLNGALTSLI